jgi:DDE family transposase
MHATRCRIATAGSSAARDAGGTRGHWFVSPCTAALLRSFAANAVRLRLYALVYNLDNFMRTLAMRAAAEPWSLEFAGEAIKIGAKVMSHGRYVMLRMAEVAVLGHSLKITKSAMNRNWRPFR